MASTSTEKFTLKELLEIVCTSLSPYYGRNTVLIQEENNEEPAEATTTRISQIDFMVRAITSEIADRYASSHSEIKNTMDLMSMIPFDEKAYPSETRSFGLITNMPN